MLELLSSSRLMHLSAMRQPKCRAKKLPVLRDSPSTLRASSKTEAVKPATREERILGLDNVYEASIRTGNNGNTARLTTFRGNPQLKRFDVKGIRGFKKDELNIKQVNVGTGFELQLRAPTITKKKIEGVKPKRGAKKEGKNCILELETDKGTVHIRLFLCPNEHYAHPNFEVHFPSNGQSLTETKVVPKVLNEENSRVVPPTPQETELSSVLLHEQNPVELPVLFIDENVYSELTIYDFPSSWRDDKLSVPTNYSYLTPNDYPYLTDEFAVENNEEEAEEAEEEDIEEEEGGIPELTVDQFLDLTNCTQHETLAF